MKNAHLYALWKSTIAISLGIFFFVLLLSGFPLQAAPSVAAPGDVIINEIMQNPNAVFDSNGEWFEVYNTTGSDIDINGWTIEDNDFDSHVISNGVPLLVPANDYLVLARDGDSGTNGGVTAAYEYGGDIALANGADEVVLLDGALTEIDRVEYDGGPNFPDPTGASMALIDPALDNNDATNWCEASTAYGDGDLGTPGTANDCISAEAALAVTKDGPAIVAIGQEVIYDITIENTGSITATNVLLTDTLPYSTTYVSDNIGVPTNVAPGVYMWSLGDVAPASSANYELTLMVSANISAGMTLTNTVIVDTDEATDDPTDNSDTAVSETAQPFAGTQEITLSKVGSITTSGSEIAAHDPVSQTLWIVTGGDFLEVLDITNPTSPTLQMTIPITPYGAGANSVDLYDGLVAVAVSVVDSVDDSIQLPGKVVFFHTNGNYIEEVTVGALPDMLTFTPDGQKVLVANEAEPNDNYDVDPEGSISIVDLGDTRSPQAATVETVDFSAFIGRENDLRAMGVRIFQGNGANAAQDVEPEFITVSPDGSTAFVTLQENNAFAVVDIDSAELLDILPLGYKNHSFGMPQLENFNFPELPELGTTPAGQSIKLGGLSGLWYEGMDGNGYYQFATVPDRGPNGAPTDVDNDDQNERPFALPDYQARVIRFTLNPNSGEIQFTETISLTRADGVTPITGLPNIPDIDEEPVDLFGTLLSYDAFGADLEGVVVNPADGHFWMVDEYRPAVYHFDELGVLQARYVPSGTAALASAPVGTYGEETLPAEYSNRRRNRGFEGMALDTDEGLLYAFIQTPLQNPDRATSDASKVIRMIGISPTTGIPVNEFVYLLEKPAYRPNTVDKIGDAVYAGDGQFFTIERDSSIEPYAKKYIHMVDLIGATNVLGYEYFTATLSGDQEVPPVSTIASGQAVLALNGTGDALTYALHIDGLDFGPALGLTPTTPISDDDVTLMHIHVAPRGSNGGVAFGLISPDQDVDDLQITINDDRSTTITGIWEETDAASQALSTFVAELRSTATGDDVDLYFNIHTVANGGGEIRGQIVAQTLEGMTPDDLAMVNIAPVHKMKVTNLPSIGYLAGDKPEGLALLPDNRLAVLNDNDFGLLDEEIPGDGSVPLDDDPTPIVLGIISFPEGGNALDASNEDGPSGDGSINIQNWPVHGMFQPDTLTAYEVDGTTFYLTANEGDARDYDGYTEEDRMGDLSLDTTIFTDSATLQDDANLGRLKTTLENGDLDNDGDFDKLFSYGARSFSIWDEYGNLVFDSSDQFERITAVQSPDTFNSNGSDSSFDSRSDDKGPEPEGITTGVINGETYAFIGLERIGGIMIYNISDPAAPHFVDYIAPPDGDVSPEGLLFIPPAHSPNGKPLLVVDYEVSGTTTIFAINVDADITVAKNAPPYGVIGEELVYTIVISNDNSTIAENVLFTDTLPISTTYIGDDSGISPTFVGNNTYIWPIGDLAADTILTIHLTVTVDANIITGTILTNTAQVSTSSTGDNLANNISQASTTVYPLVSISDIQQVPAGSNDSPLEGETVWTEGIVTAEPGEIDNPSRLMVIQDPAGGPWSGLVIFRNIGFGMDIPAGSYIRVLGVVDEFFGLTELNLDNVWVVDIMGTAPIPAPALLTTADFPADDGDISEAWESVYIQFENATVTDDDIGNDEWVFDDGSGPTHADDLGERDGDLSYQPTNGDVYQFIRGIGWYSFSDYKLEPRDNRDIALLTEAPGINKVAPEVVLQGTTFTYTIMVNNTTGMTLTDVVITDVLPAGVTVANVLDGGSVNNGTVTWNVGDLGNLSLVQASVIVTATGEQPVVVNFDYAVIASNYVTPTFGPPVFTTVDDGQVVPIYDVQGDTDVSPYEGGIVTVAGVVVGFFEGNSSEHGNFDGFFLQDTTGDGDTDTSDGIFIDYGSLNVSVSVGDIVTVTGAVEEYSEWEGEACPADEGCVTQIAVESTSDIVTGGNTTLPLVVILDPPGDPIEAAAYYESLEGMLVTLPMTGVVVGPTSFNTIHVVPGDAGVDRVLRNTPEEGMTFGVRHYELFGDINGNDAPGLIVGSIVDNADGPFTFSYGAYMVATQEGDAWNTVSSAPVPTEVPEFPAAMPDSFTAATFNTLNFDDPTDEQMTKVVSTVVQLNGPTFIALQEISVSDVMTDLLDNLEMVGYDYVFANSHPDIGNHGVALIWRTDQIITGTASTQYQSCSTLGSSSALAYDDYCDGTGLFPLFSRRPVVVTATVALTGGDSIEVVVIANHFKSKLGGTPSDLRRLEQAEFVASLADDFVVNTPHVMVLGDLNDFEDSPPLEAMYASGNLTSTWGMVAPESRYTFIFRGVSQILDHVLVSPALLPWLEMVDPLHMNADFPFAPFTNDDTVVWRTSDHDPVAALFRRPPAPPQFAELQVVHLAPFAAGDAAIDVYLNGTQVLTDVAYNTSSGYLTVPAGDHLVEVNPAGSSTVAVSTTISLAPDSDNSVMAIGGANSYALQLVHLVDNVVPTSVSRVGDTGYVRVGHLAPFDSDMAATAVNIINDADDSVILSNVQYGDIAPYLALPAGEYDLRIELAADNTILFDLAPITVATDNFIAAYAVGDGANQIPDVVGVLGKSGSLPSLLAPIAEPVIYLPLFFNN